MTKLMTMGDFIDMLQAKGLIERVAPPNPMPGMVLPFTMDRISITEAGRRLIEDLPPTPAPFSPSPSDAASTD